MGEILKVAACAGLTMLAALTSGAPAQAADCHWFPGYAYIVQLAQGNWRNVNWMAIKNAANRRAGIVAWQYYRARGARGIYPTEFWSDCRWNERRQPFCRVRVKWCAQR